MLHHKLAFKLFVELQSHGNDYQHTGSAESVDQRTVKHKREYQRRHYRDKRKIYSAEKRDSLRNPDQILVSRLSRSDTGDKPAVLLNVS